MSEQLGQVGTQFLFENEQVRVWHLVLEPRESSSWHLHTLDYLYVVIESGRVRAEYQDGTFQEQQDEPGQVVMCKAGPIHRLVNLGDSRYVNVVIELKSGSQLHSRDARLDSQDGQPYC
jgi:beta-alanine degradation protein BauB